MKIDIQGGELGCLRGCSELLSKQDIDTLFVKFGGESEILSLLSEYGYSFFDSEYLAIPRSEQPSYESWRTFRKFQLSTGRLAYRAWPITRPAPIDEYCSFLRAARKRHGSIYTEMVCVSSRALAAFHPAAECAHQASVERSRRVDGDEQPHYVAALAT